MSKRNRKRSTSKKQVQHPNPQQVVLNDFRIEMRTIDRSSKDLDKWRSALLSAENITRPNRAQLYDLYHDIILDDAWKSAWDQRELAITNTSLVFQRDGKEVKSIQDVINTDEFETLLKHMLESKSWGHSLIHSDFRAGICELVPRVNVYPQKSIVTPDPYTDEGINYINAPYSNYYLSVGRPDDLGLILIATPLVLIKRGDLSDWAQFNEIFGQPTRVGKYDPNMPGHHEQMKKALEDAGALAYLTIPTNGEIEFVEANKQGATDSYDTLYERMEKGISRLVVGQTMTLFDGSSRAQGEVHERTKEAIARSDRRYMLRYLNRQVRRMLLAQGYSEAANGDFQFVEEEEAISKKDRLQMDLSIHTTVGPLKKDYFATEYNVEFVDNSDEQEQPEPDQEDEQEKAPDPKKKVNLTIPDDFFE